MYGVDERKRVYEKIMTVLPPKCRMVVQTRLLIFKYYYFWILGILYASFWLSLGLLSTIVS